MEISLLRVYKNSLTVSTSRSHSWKFNSLILIVSFSTLKIFLDQSHSQSRLSVNLLSQVWWLHLLPTPRWRIVRPWSSCGLSRGSGRRMMPLGFRSFWWSSVPCSCRECRRARWTGRRLRRGRWTPQIWRPSHLPCSRAYLQQTRVLYMFCNLQINFARLPLKLELPKFFPTGIWSVLTTVDWTRSLSCDSPFSFFSLSIHWILPEG